MELLPSRLALWSLLLLAVTAVYGIPSQPLARAATKTYCTPTQACWPKAADWATFNRTLGGALIQVKPWADPCFTKPDGFNLAQCELVKLGYMDGKTRADQVGVTQLDNWSYCYTNQGLVGDCSLSNTLLGVVNPLPAAGTCGLGRISPYAVNVGSAQDVQKALAFAQAFNIKVVIKNTGHEYLGRGTAPDSLMLWTHNLKSMTYNDNFLGKNAVILGAGVIADDAYRFAFQNGKTITLGAYMSVGVAGGFAMGGGHGPLQPTYGLAVDNILQFTVVTSDGIIRTANANSEPDLFWALRGGGGGTYGVVVETVYQVHPPTSVVSVVYNLTINPLFTQQQKLAAIADFVKNQAIYQPGWTKMGWSGYTFLTTSYILFSQFLPSSDLAGATASMKDMIAYMTLNNQWIVTTPIVSLSPTFEDWRNFFLTLGAGETPVAYNERLASRLIPYSVFETDAGRVKLGQDVAGAYGQANSNDGIPAADVQFRAGESIQLYSTGPKPAAYGGPSGNDTGVNPAWRSSLWEVLLFTNYVTEMSQDGRNKLAQKTSSAVDPLRAYGTGTYFSESDVLESNWQTAFFGSNYKRLLQIKNQYDRTNTFVVYKGVGYEGQEKQTPFKCYQQA